MTDTDNDRLSQGIRHLLEEYARSVTIHTDWQEYEEPMVFEAVEDEFLEYRRAIKFDILDGSHCKSTEALHLACVAFKAYLFHRHRQLQNHPLSSLPDRPGYFVHGGHT